MYSLSLIVALIPIFFSHILSRFGIFFMEGSSFERVKVYLFLILICAAFIEMVVFSFEEVVAFFQKNYPIVLTLFFLPILFQFIRGGVLDPLFFW